MALRSNRTKPPEEEQSWAGVHAALHSLRRAFSPLAPLQPGLHTPLVTGMTERTKTCRFRAPFLLCTQPPGRGCLLTSPKSQLGLTRVVYGELTLSPKGGELPHFFQLGSSTSKAPSKLAAQYPHQSHPSKPQHPNTSPFPATDTQLGVHIYIKSRVYCHFYLDLHNCVTASDVKRDVPSLPRELAREGGEPRSTGWLPPTQQAGPQPLSWLCPAVSPDPPSTAAWLCHGVCQRGVNPSPSFMPLAVLATQLQPLAIPVLPRIPQLYRDRHGWPRAGHPTALWALLVCVFIHRYGYRRCPN